LPPLPIRKNSARFRKGVNAGAESEPREALKSKIPTRWFGFDATRAGGGLDASEPVMAGSSNREEKVSGRKALATARTTRRNHATTADSGHARTESVATLAHDLAGLVRPLHGSSPVLETGPGA
jgi:hypothetical protein